MCSRKWLLPLVAVALTGCHAAGVGNLTRNDPIPVPQNTAIADAVDAHNKNAAQVTRLSSLPSVSIESARFGGNARGVLALEKPRNFRFKLESGMGRDEADVGSNDQEFWFWAARSKDRGVFVCRYDTNGEAPPELTFQPEWIVEALGLREIPDQERSKIKVSSTKDPKVEQWTHQRTNARGESTVKVTYVDKLTGRVLNHYFYGPDNRALASATPSNYERVTLPGGGDENGGEASPRTVLLPKTVRLKLISSKDPQQQFAMTLDFDELKVNAPISTAQRDDLFTVPRIRGYPLVRLDEQAGSISQSIGGAQIRRSRPAPESTSGGSTGVRLNEPVPIGADQAYLKRSDPMPLSPDLSEPDTAQAILGSKIPRPPATAISRSGGEWRRGE